MIYNIMNYLQNGIPFSRVVAYVAGFLFAMVIALSMHEFAHAFTAYKCGDYTPKALGRLSLNPLKHIDGFGLFAFLFVGFGWAKPVEINPLNFKKFRRDTFLVSIAGVLTNLALSFIFSGIYFFYFTNVAQIDAGGQFFYSNELLYFLHYFFETMVVLNIALFVFNLIPIFPLDGFNAIKSLFKLNNKFVNFMYRYGNLLLIILIITPIFDLFYNVVTGFFLETFFRFWGLFI